MKQGTTVEEDFTVSTGTVSNLPIPFFNNSATNSKHEYLSKMYEPDDARFWKDPDTVKAGPFHALLAICPEREEPRFFLQKTYRQTDEVTKFSVSLKDAEALCKHARLLLAEIDSVGYGQITPSLASFPEYASIDPRETLFWDKKVAWATDSEEVRCRIYIKPNGEKNIIVNSPRDIAELKNWRGPTFW